MTSKSGSTPHGATDSFQNGSAGNLNQGSGPGRPANSEGPGSTSAPPEFGNQGPNGPQHGGFGNQQIPPGSSPFQQPPPNALQGPPASAPGNISVKLYFTTKVIRMECISLTRVYRFPGADGARMPIIPNAPPPIRPNIPPFGMPPQFRPPGPGFPMSDPTGPVPTGDDKTPLDLMAGKIPQIPPQQAHHPPGFPAFGPPLGAPPPFVMQPPPVFPQTLPFPQPWGPLGGVPAPTGVPPPLFSVEPVIAGMDPKVIAKAYEWSEHISPDGKTYYFNAKTNSSVWEKPVPLVEFEGNNITFAKVTCGNTKYHVNY